MLKTRLREKLFAQGIGFVSVLWLLLRNDTIVSHTIIAAKSPRNTGRKYGIRIRTGQRKTTPGFVFHPCNQNAYAYSSSRPIRVTCPATVQPVSMKNFREGWRIWITDRLIKEFLASQNRRNIWYYPLSFRFFWWLPHFLCKMFILLEIKQYWLLICIINMLRFYQS